MTPTQREDGKPAATPPARGWLPVRPKARLQTAADVLFPTSIRATSIDAICEEATVPKSGFYRHFPSKDELILDYVHRRSDAVRDTLRLFDGAIADPIQRLMQLHTLGHDNSLLIRAAVEFPDSSTEINITASRHRQWIRQWIANQLLEVGIHDPRIPALEIAAFFDVLTFEPIDSTEHKQTQQMLLRKIEALPS